MRRFVRNARTTFAPALSVALVCVLSNGWAPRCQPPRQLRHASHAVSAKHPVHHYNEALAV
jgi:hypothetical protein